MNERFVVHEISGFVIAPALTSRNTGSKPGSDSFVIDTLVNHRDVVVFSSGGTSGGVNSTNVRAKAQQVAADLNAEHERWLAGYDTADVAERMQAIVTTALRPMDLRNQEILRSRAEGLSLRAIARKFGLSNRRVTQILRDK